LNWHKKLIALRRELPALRDGGMVMVDTTNSSVLSYVRTAPAGAHAVVVALNMTEKPQTIALDLSRAGISSRAVRTLLTDQIPLQGVPTTSMTLPPFASWVGEVR
jgi:alpha-glucosidase